MASNQSLPVILPTVPRQSWSCHSCGDCCRSLVGDLREDERHRLDEQGWKEKLGVEPYVRLGKGWALNKRDDNACVFLTEDNRCRIHAEYGEEAKPFACRIFPFSVRPVRAGWQSSLRFDCPSVIASRGETLRGNRLGLQILLKELDHDERAVNAPIHLQKGIAATEAEVEYINRAYLDWFSRVDLPLHDRLLGAAHVTTTLAAADLRKVRDERLHELLEILFAAVGTECDFDPPPPAERQLSLLRQLAFAHLEHVTLQQRSAGYVRRLGMRREQLRRASRFRRGEGLVPGFSGVHQEVSFDEIDRVKPCCEQTTETEDLLLRYLHARITSQSVFGAGYYGWPVVKGFIALSAALVVVGWLARYMAVAGGDTSLKHEHIGWALGMMDRGATRIPALGTVAERMRASYFLMEDGLVRLTHHCPLVDDKDDNHDDRD